MKQMKLEVLVCNHGSAAAVEDRSTAKRLPLPPPWLAAPGKRRETQATTGRAAPIESAKINHPGYCCVFRVIIF